MRILLVLLCFSSTAHAALMTVASFGSMGSDKALLGRYLRTQNHNPRLYQNRIVGQVGTHCTGTLIGPKHVLTAAHCILKENDLDLNEDLSFNPGSMSKYSIPYSKVDWSRVYLPERYDNHSNNYQHDFAVIELKENIGDKLGWAGMKVLNKVPSNYRIFLTGYPLDKEEGTQWSVACPANIIELEITYSCDTYGGMSGSAVFSQNGDSTRFINGVHLFATRNSNGALRITNSRFSMINSWLLGKPSDGTKIYKNK